MKTTEYQIKPSQGPIRLNLSELWRFRELFYILVWRDIKARYKQTVLGVSWALFQPLATMAIFTFLFGRLVKVPSENTPYPIFVYSGLLLWNYFVSGLTTASNSLVDNEGIIKKIYFPRMILPLSTAVTPALDFLFALVVLFGLMLIYRFLPMPLGVIILPLLLIFSFFSIAGLGMLLASLNAKYRDVRYLLPFSLQLLFFLTPVVYPVSLVPGQFQWLLFLNPMAGIITLARSTLLGTPAPDFRLLGLSFMASLILFLVGVAYFRKTERFFADVL